MGDFKNEYRQAIDRLEPDGRLIESLKADMKASKNAAPEPSFFVRYGWAFGSAAACLVVALAVGVMLTLGNAEQLSGGSSMANGAALEGAAAEMVENAPFGVNGDIADNAGEMDGEGFVGFEPSANDEDGWYNADGYGRGEYETIEDTAGSAPVITTARPSSEGFKTNYYPMPYVEPQQVEALKPLSYEELKALMMTDRSESELILSDFSMYDCIEVLGNDKYYLVLRFDYYVFTFPIVAAFQGMSPEDTIMSLCLYKDYNDLSAYINLREISSLDDLAYLIYPSGYVYSFGDDDLYFEDRDLEQLTPITDEQFLELTNRAGRGTLAFSDFEKLDIFYVGLSSDTYTFVCTYREAATEREYFLISHFPDKGHNTAPDYLILRRRNSLKEVDLLNDYDMLVRFLAG